MCLFFPPLFTLEFVSFFPLYLSSQDLFFNFTTDSFLQTDRQQNEEDTHTNTERESYRMRDRRTIYSFIIKFVFITEHTQKKRVCLMERVASVG